MLYWKLSAQELEQKWQEKIAKIPCGGDPRTPAVRGWWKHAVPRKLEAPHESLIHSMESSSTPTSFLDNMVQYCTIVGHLLHAGTIHMPEKYMNLVSLFLIFLCFPGRLMNHKASLYKRYTMFIDWRTWYCRAVTSPQDKLVTDPHIYCSLTYEKNKGYWSTMNVLFPDLGPGYIRASSLWNFNKLYIYTTALFCSYIMLELQVCFQSLCKSLNDIFQKLNHYCSKNK